MSIKFELNDSLLLGKLSNEGFLCVVTSKQEESKRKQNVTLKNYENFHSIC